MKTVLGLILLSLLTGCASRPNDSMQNSSEIKAEVKARDDFAKSLPKPPER
jgi:predicted component of type VI protein secretion system